MKKIVIGVLIVALICAAGLGVYSLCNSSITNDNGGNGPGVNENGSVINNEEQPVVTPNFPIIDFEEEYYESVNADITLEQLQNSKVVRGVRILNEGSPHESASIFIFRAEVIGILDRVLTLTKEGDVLELYIGGNAEIDLTTPDKPSKAVPFSEIKKGDLVSIGAGMQTSTSSPLWIKGVSIHRGFD